jgi:hypothetical protein
VAKLWVDGSDPSSGGPTQPPIQWVPGALSPAGRTGLESEILELKSTRKHIPLGVESSRRRN